MCHALLHDPAFFRLLTRIDIGFATQIQQARCPKCAGPLHVADFPRKPRGCPPSVREEYSWRLSFTCGWCDARSTPASVRFLGRRIYVAMVLMLVSPAGGSAAGALAEQLSVPASTMKRWRIWWRKEFQRTGFWQLVRERFVPPVAAESLPQSLFARFQGRTDRKRLLQLLCLVRPLSGACVIN